MSVPENRILGSYRLIERIGKGGMGEVYRAEHLKLGREAAVKVLPVNLVNEADFLKRFEREASSAAKLEHPNILPVYEYGETPTPYLVMPYVKGGTLKDKMTGSKLAPGEITNYLRQMAEALDYAHEQGIIHRDVKPANMLLDERGRLYLGDFGIAKALEGAEGLTRTGVGVGTPEYMAPEQAQGRADSRSDLYALGIILYQMLTGRVPYSGNSTVEVLMKHLQDPLPMLPLRSVQPALPSRIEQIIQKALAKNPNDRYGSGRAMVEDVTEAMAAGPGASAANDATVLGGMAGAATVVSNTPPPMGTTRPMGSTPPPLSNTPPPMGVTPPMGMNQPPYNAATVVGGAPQYGASNQPPQFGGNTPPPQFGGGTPPPMGGGGGMGPPPIYPPQGQRPQPQPSGNRNGLLIGIAAAVGVLLLLCVGGAAFLATRGGDDPTPTVVASSPSASAVAAANLSATQTAAARPSAAASASASSAASAPASAAASASGGPSAAPSASSSVAPSVAPSSAPPSVAASTPASAAPSATARPSAAPSATARPSAAPSATARPSAAASNRPLGTAPAGWKTYGGSARVPFAMYYPPDWTVDDSGAADGRIYFYGPGVTQPIANELWVLVATTGVRDPQGNVDVLRDQYYRDQFAEYPEAAIDITRQNRFSNITFASLGVTFNEGSDLCYAYIGLGLNNQVPWRFRLNSIYADYDGNLDNFFNGMISSMNIYANP